MEEQIIKKALRQLDIDRLYRDKYLLNYIKIRFRFSLSRSIYHKRVKQNFFWRYFLVGKGELDRWYADKETAWEYSIDWDRTEKKRNEEGDESLMVYAYKCYVDKFFHYGALDRAPAYGWNWIHQTRSDKTLNRLARWGTGEGGRTLRWCLLNVKKHHF